MSNVVRKTREAVVLQRAEQARQERESAKSEIGQTPNKHWRHWHDECPECGAAVEVFTVSEFCAYDGDVVKCTECTQTGWVSADETGVETEWNEPELPELTDEDRAKMNAIPADAVAHLANGETWDGSKWVQCCEHVESFIDMSGGFVGCLKCGRAL